jgi:hypothetical protein
LHEDLDGFLGGHGILLPWEWLAASSAGHLLISSEVLRENLIGERRSLSGGKAAFALVAFLLVDTIEKIQHNSCYDNIVSGWEWVQSCQAGKPLSVILSFWRQKRHKEP